MNNKMIYYDGVMTEASAPEESRVIQFPKGEYLVVKEGAKTADELGNNLADIAFGQVLLQSMVRFFVTNVSAVYLSVFSVLIS